MKKFTKIKTKKGFTLLETLLATAILVIVGSMLMEGFIAAMGYSYNSSVYARSASYNSQLCLTQLATWSMLAENKKSITSGKYDKEYQGYAAVGTYVKDPTNNYTDHRTLFFSGGTAGSVLGRINVAVYEEKGVNPALSANDLNSFKGEQINNNQAYADNRAIVFYYPTVNGTSSDAYFGRTHLYMMDRDKADGSGKETVKVWGYDKDDDEDKPTYIQDFVARKQ